MTKSSDPAAPMPPMSASGSVRSPGERNPLSVTLTVSGTDVALRSGDLELGTWQTSDVEISAVDATRFAFEAEGDRLIFTADDPTSFASHPLVHPYPGSQEAKDSQPKPKRKRRKKRSRTPAPPPTSAVTETAPPAVDLDAPAPDVAEVTPTDESSEVDQPAVEEMSAGSVVEATASTEATGRLDDATPPDETQKRKTASAGRGGPWIRTLDMARRNGFFGLDRVQVAEGLRGQEHQHTFDHGAAAGYGPSKHICTICGKVKLGR
jgi:hypothetical protein